MTSRAGPKRKAPPVTKCIVRADLDPNKTAPLDREYRNPRAAFAPIQYSQSPNMTLIDRTAATAQGATCASQSALEMLLTTPEPFSASTWQRLVQGHSFDRLNPKFLPDAFVDRLNFREWCHLIWRRQCEAQRTAVTSSSNSISSNSISSNSISNSNNASSVAPFCSTPTTALLRFSPTADIPCGYFDPRLLLSYWFAHRKLPGSNGSADGGNGSCARAIGCATLRKNQTYELRFFARRSAPPHSNATRALYDDTLCLLQLFPLGTTIDHLVSLINALYEWRTHTLSHAVRTPCTRTSVYRKLALHGLLRLNARRPQPPAAAALSTPSDRPTSPKHLDTRYSSAASDSGSCYYDADDVNSDVVCIYDGPSLRCVILSRFIRPNTASSILAHTQAAVVARAGGSLASWSRHGPEARALLESMVTFYWRRQTYKWHAQLMRLMSARIGEANSGAISSPDTDDVPYRHNRSIPIGARGEQEITVAATAMYHELRTWLFAPQSTVLWSTICDMLFSGTRPPGKDMLRARRLDTDVHERSNIAFGVFWCELQSIALTTPTDPCWWYLEMRVDHYYPYLVLQTRASEKYAHDRALRRAFKNWLRARQMLAQRMAPCRAWCSSASTAPSSRLPNNSAWELCDTEEERERAGLWKAAYMDAVLLHGSRVDTMDEAWYGERWDAVEKRYVPYRPFWLSLMGTRENTSTHAREA